MRPRPDFMLAIAAASRPHVTDGALPRAQHALSASAVAALNRCRSCLGSHAWFRQSQGEGYAATAHAIRDGARARAPLPPAERPVRDVIGTLTRHAERRTDRQVEGLRDAGWTDPQIAEAVDVGARFNRLVRLVRLADACDIHPPAPDDSAGGPPAAAAPNHHAASARPRPIDHGGACHRALPRARGTR